MFVCTMFCKWVFSCETSSLLSDRIYWFPFLQIKKLEDYGQIDFDEMVKEKFKLTYVPNWFNVDLKTGVRSIFLFIIIIIVYFFFFSQGSLVEY